MQPKNPKSAPVMRLLVAIALALCASDAALAQKDLLSCSKCNRNQARCNCKYCGYCAQSGHDSSNCRVRLRDEREREERRREEARKAREQEALRQQQEEAARRNRETQDRQREERRRVLETEQKQRQAEHERRLVEQERQAAVQAEQDRRRWEQMKRDADDRQRRDRQSALDEVNRQMADLNRQMAEQNSPKQRGMLPRAGRRLGDAAAHAFSDPSVVYGGVDPLELAYDNFADFYDDPVREALAAPIERAGDGVAEVFEYGFKSAAEPPRSGSSSPPVRPSPDQAWYPPPGYVAPPVDLEILKMLEAVPPRKGFRTDGKRPRPAQIDQDKDLKGPLDAVQVRPPTPVSGTKGDDTETLVDVVPPR